MIFKKISLSVGLGLILFFIIAAFLNEKKIIYSEDIKVQEHAKVLADAMWKIDSDAIREYLKLASDAEKYEIISLKYSDGELFAQEKSSTISNLDKFLISLNIMQRHTYNADVFYKDERIGMIEAVHINDRIYMYATWVLLLFLIYIVFALYIRILSAKYVLEDKVRERTIELQRSKSYLNDVFDSIESILLSLDDNLLITNINTYALSKLKMSKSNVIGTTLFETLPELLEFESEIRNVAFNHKVFEINKVPLTFKGEETFVNMACFPIKSYEVVGVVLRIDDVTKMVSLEDMMIQTEKMASLGSLAAGMAHEINNPLGAILQGIQNVERRFSDSIAQNVELAEEIGVDLHLTREYMARRGITDFLIGVVDAGKRASEIVSNMLQFSRLSKSEKEPCFLHNIVDSALELASTDYDLAGKYDFRHINIIKDLSSSNSIVVCTKTEIEQVLLNFLKNGAYAIFKKEFNSEKPQITIRSFDQGNKVRIEIEDNGCGMDENTTKRIFDPFFTTKPAGSGTGLGLSVSYFIIKEKHNGAIFAESKLGQGAKFTVILPKA